LGALAWPISEADAAAIMGPVPPGLDLDLTFGAEPACWTPLAYPAARVGAHLVECPICGLRLVCGANGRPDDPRTIKVACRQSKASPAA
jgi:hypothetical protein